MVDCYALREILIEKYCEFPTKAIGKKKGAAKPRRRIHFTVLGEFQLGNIIRDSTMLLFLSVLFFLQTNTAYSKNINFECDEIPFLTDNCKIYEFFIGSCFPWDLSNCPEPITIPFFGYCPCFVCKRLSTTVVHGSCNPHILADTTKSGGSSGDSTTEPQSIHKSEVIFLLLIDTRKIDFF